MSVINSGGAIKEIFEYPSLELRGKSKLDIAI